jgi:hypothetical protein
LGRGLLGLLLLLQLSLRLLLLLLLLALQVTQQLQLQELLPRRVRPALPLGLRHGLCAGCLCAGCRSCYRSCRGRARLGHSCCSSCCGRTWWPQR